MLCLFIEFGKNANSIYVGTVNPYRILTCFATVRVCVFRALALAGAFYMGGYMLMKKKLMVCFLSVAILCTAFSAFVACDKPHEHVYSSEWAVGEIEHWHECVCGEKSEVESHIWANDGVCKICDYSIFDGTYEEITLEKAKNFAGKLQTNGKTFDWKNGYQISSDSEIKGFRKDENSNITSFLSETAGRVYTGERNNDTVGQAVLNVIKTYEGGQLEEILQTEAWYQGSYAFVETITDVSDIAKYKEKMDFDKFLMDYGKFSSKVDCDFTMFLQIISGGFYKQYSLLLSQTENYQKYKIVVPRQGDDDIENAITVILIYNNDNALCACNVNMEQYITLPTTGVGAGEGVTENMSKVIVMPYVGEVQLPEDPGSYPDKAEDSLS